MTTTTRSPSPRSAHARLAGGLAACITALMATAPVAAELVSTIRVQQTDASGRPNGHVFFKTIRLPAPVVPQYLASGPAPGLDAPFISAGGAHPASVWLDLDPGLHTFTMAANQGSRIHPARDGQHTARPRAGHPADDAGRRRGGRPVLAPSRRAPGTRPARIGLLTDVLPARPLCRRRRRPAMALPPCQFRRPLGRRRRKLRPQGLCCQGVASMPMAHC
jgi:hypothetical protein